ncbi:MAG: TIGR02281 family clan AA aspartic protease [Candidatus Accumulibacter phosphatis]|jgi:aspartyl protease family protein|uniref:Clan AA aspartic protease n=3 Tax=Candidatus Accumulibacter TaxID=327159 RepID=A0A080M6K7_9PROT|nr:TIGR02281 family clan AA aspartic protease [Candidatus Accumulibacter contiguus]KFB72744.1 MAG: clan AA aspartic protease [Candidatus Accumulibacter phosphatis]MBL8408997.1 TIGR02281 family clan AA aspartic protease [Accumulibacter sp.]NMQ07023.1 TIGR02281 family clan AA aspartic protease [Candidatus Accumulibacter contiguus]HRF13731.1 TIGR02281 family clan AA aspartic protease [Candidatus Accumulibacter phosphatis]
MVEHCIRRGGRWRCGWTAIRQILCLSLCTLYWPALAADVGLAGVFPGKALLTINGGAPRTVAVGAKTDEGVKVLSVDNDTATIEIDGKKRILRVGQNVASQPSGDGGGKAVLTADGSGHFLTTGNINGTTIRFLVDTGATMISLGAGDARRIGIDASKGQRGITNTANGPASVIHVKLDTVRVGEIVLNNVDALVHQQDLPFALLGMSFLNRMEMQRDGQTMTLRKRY